MYGETKPKPKQKARSVKKMNKNDWSIESKKFRDKRTGAIVTQFDILDIGFMEEVTQ